MNDLEEIWKVLNEWEKNLTSSKNIKYPDDPNLIQARAICEAQSKAFVPDEKMVETIYLELTAWKDDVIHEYETSGSVTSCRNEAKCILSQLNIPARIEAAKKEEREKLFKKIQERFDWQAKNFENTPEPSMHSDWHHINKDWWQTLSKEER